MKKKFKKGAFMMIWENGEPTNNSTNLDEDRELEVGEIFTWNPFKDKTHGNIKMKVLSIDFPLTVEELI